MQNDIPWLLANRAQQLADKPFLIWQPLDKKSEVFSYQDFFEQVKAVAAGLQARGIEKGDAVALLMGNQPEFLLSWFACAELGAVAVSLNTRSTANEIDYFIRHCKAVAAITDPNLLPLLAATQPSLQFCVVTSNEPLPPGTVPFSELTASNALAQQPSWDSQTPLAVQYTSGTTSKPKAVLWTHANALWSGRVSALHQRFSGDDICLTFLPLYHTNALGYAMLAVLWSGATLVLQPRFSASRFWPVALQHRCTYTHMVPFCFKAVRQQPLPERHFFRHWGFGVSHAEVDSAFGLRTIGYWGMTETIAQPIVSDPAFTATTMAMGWPSTHYGVKVLDNAGNEVSSNGVGRLYIKGERGVSLFKEYWYDPEATRKAFTPDGWLDTGDNVRVDQDGLLFFEGRDQDMLKVGGENVAVADVELIISRIPGVVDVAVLGRDDDMLGEVPVAVVQAERQDRDAFEQEILAVCRDKLSAFKVPQQIHFVEKMPRTGVGKVVKKILQKQILEAVNE